MDYRCQYCGRKLNTGLRCEVCDAKRGAGEVKIMTTPTKEQIEQITKECLRKGGSTWTFQKIAELSIWEWEKIRNSPK